MTPNAALDDPQTHITVTGRGQLKQLALPKGTAFAARLGHQVDWSLAGDVDREMRAIDLSRGSN